MISDAEANKIKTIFQVIIFAIIVIGVIIFKGIPQLKETVGSSDLYIDLDNYSAIVGIEVEDGADFALVLSEDKVTGILFFNTDALAYYNKSIEKKSLDESLETLVEILNDYNLNSSIKLINYSQNKEIYDKIRMYIDKKYKDKVYPKEAQLTDKAKELGLVTYSDEEAIQNLYNYSVSIIKQYKNERITEKVYTMDKDKAKEYAINIYNKLVVYANYVDNQEVANEQYPIQLIEVDINEIEDEDVNKKIMPDSNSWYYIRDGLVYAYIEFNDGDNNYGFCFSENINSMKEGNCNEKFG